MTEPHQAIRASEVATVVLTHNPGPVLLRVLDAVRTQSPPPGVVVVVDNGSANGIVDTLEGEAGVHVLPLGENLGVGAGHNRGWAAARQLLPDARAIWALEHDSIPEPGTLNRLLTTLDELTQAGLAVAVVMPQQISPGETPPPASPPLAVRRFSFNAVLLTVEALDRVGTLREDFFVGQEDRELAHRLLRDGYEIVRDFRALVEHTNRRRPNPPSILRAYYRSRNEAYLSIHVRHDRWGRLRAGAAAAGGVARILRHHDRKWTRIRARVRATADAVRGDMGQKRYSYLDGR